MRIVQFGSNFVSKIKGLISSPDPKVIVPEEPAQISKEQFAERLKLLNINEPWCVDHVNLDGNMLEISGWAIAPEGDPTKATFTVNGEEFHNIKYPLLREDIGRLFWYYPGSENSGFTCQIPVTAENSGTEQIFEFQFVFEDTFIPVHQGHSYFIDLGTSDKYPVPDVDRRIRVHGGNSEDAFLLEGFSTFRKLQVTLETVFSKEFDDFDNLLDWGCGCGRLTRYFSEQQKVLITGIDIDADNVSWCQNNLGFGTFTSIPLHPPTKLRSDEFDLLIGISIFTHLREQEQFEWLKELERMAKKGAILLMTVHGNSTVGRANLDISAYQSLLQKGFLDIGINPNLGESIDDQEYYRNTFHTHDYIRENWAKYFEIIELIPGYIGNHQDLVVLRKN